MTRAEILAVVKARNSLYGVDLRGAYLEGADLEGADLKGADLEGADLKGADLRGANLRGAYLKGADLRGTNLEGTNLEGADLEGADLGKQWIIQGLTRADGHAFFLQNLTGDKEPMVKAGCRHFPIKQARAHWNATRKGTKLGKETMAIIRNMIEVAKIRGYMK